jgi:hypothetical protein
LEEELILAEVLGVDAKHVLVAEHDVEHGLVGAGVQVEAVLRDLCDDVVELLLFLFDLALYFL